MIGKWIRSFAVGCAVIFLLVTPCFAESEQPIGAIYPLTGNGAEIGEQRTRGATLALERLNSSGNHFRLFIEDSASDAKIGVTAFRFLTETKGVRTVFSALSGVTMALKPMAESRRVLLFGNVSHPDITKGASFVLRSYYAVDRANDTFFEFTTRKNISTIALLYVEDEFGQSLASSLLRRAEASHLSVKESLSFKNSELDFRLYGTKIAPKKVDLLYVVGLGQALVQAVKQMKNRNVAREILIWNGCGQVELRAKQPELFTGILSIDPSIDTQSAEYASFRNEYQKKYPGELVSPIAVAEYDSMMMYADAWKKVGPDPEKIRESILQHGLFRGASGEISFDPTGDAQWPMAVSRMNRENCDPQ